MHHTFSSRADWSIEEQYHEQQSRAQFLIKTYANLTLALVAFVGIEIWLLSLPFAATVAGWMTNGIVWIGVLLVYTVVSGVLESAAHSIKSRVRQYIFLALYVGIEAVIFLPLVLIALHLCGPAFLVSCGLITAGLTFGLTGVILVTGNSFSFLRSFLVMGAMVAFGVIIAAVLFGFHLGVIFSGCMILFACAAILYSTGRVIHEYDEDQDVSAALTLFAAIALLLWYVIRFGIQLYLESQE